MESKLSTQIKVGIFLTIGVLVTLVSIFFLGADKALFTSYVRVNVHFEQVQGLAKGSVISLSGITVGNVEDITFLPEKNALNVVLKIDKKYIDRIRTGSEVDIRTQGALGDKFIYIIPSALAGDVIKEGDVLPVAKPTDLFSLISERGSEAAKLFEAIDNINQITKAINHDNRIVRLMNNLETMSENLNSSSKNAEKIMTSLASYHPGERVGKSLDKLEAIIGKIDRGEGSLGALINDPTIHDRIKSFLGGSQRKTGVENLLRTSIEGDSK